MHAKSAKKATPDRARRGDGRGVVFGVFDVGPAPYDIVEGSQPSRPAHGGRIGVRGVVAHSSTHRLYAAQRAEQGTDRARDTLQLWS